MVVRSPTDPSVIQAASITANCAGGAGRNVARFMDHEPDAAIRQPVGL